MMISRSYRCCVKWIALVLCLSLNLQAEIAEGETFDVWVGTTREKQTESKGIYHCTLDAERGRLTTPTLAAEIESPGFLALDPNEKILYATGRQHESDSLSAYRIGRINQATKLVLINSQPIGDGGAAHLDTDRNGKFLFSAQYGGGSVAVFPIQDDGSIGKRTQLAKHKGGSGVVENRQDSPHPHWVGTSPDNRFVFVPDLGLDGVVIYSLGEDTPQLTPHGSGIAPAGGGPRHMKFHPNGKFVYLLNELALSVTVFTYDAEQGTLSAIQTIPTLSEAAKAKEPFVSASEIRIHPTGKFVYAATRGHDSISVFETQADGKLKLVEIEHVRGSWPRNFNLDPTGKWLIAAGRDSNTLAVFAIDSSTGELSYTGHTAPVPNPICVLFGKP